MIYEVYVNDELLYYPNDDTYALSNTVVSMSLNEAGSFECDIPASNPRYNEINLRQSMIQVLKDGEEIFYGEVREITQNFDFTKHVYAVGELAFLFDSIQPQARYQNVTVEDLFTAILAKHNSQVEDRKKFTVGTVLVTDPNNSVYHYTNREDTLTAIREKLCNTLDGYLRIRKVGSTRYLDFVPLDQYGSYCLQEIQFGENLLDYSCNYTAQDIATAVIPLGVRLEEEQRTTDAIEGLDEYLTIKGTSADDYHANINDDFVYIQSAVNRFGWVRVVRNWDDVTIKENLKSKAEEWLESAQYSQLILQVNAVDLNLLDNNIESFEIGDTVHCWAEPYGMDTTFPVQSKTTYINDLSQNYITLSNSEPSKSYTSQTSDAVNKVKEEIPEVSPLLEQAKDRALSMLLSGSTGGHVVFEWHYNEEGEADYIEALSLCNAPTIDASTTRWRWSNGSFGYMKRSNINVPWDYSDVPIALTANGEINADLITAGTIDADVVRVKGRLEATSGYIGRDDDIGWEIGDHSIYNGTDSIQDTRTEGTYVGTDGVLNVRYDSNNNKYIYSRLMGGVFNTNGAVTASTVNATGSVSAGAVYADDTISGDKIGANTYYAYDDGLQYVGQDTETFTVQAIIDGDTRYVGLKFRNGLLVGKSNV